MSSVFFSTKKLVKIKIKINSPNHRIQKFETNQSFMVYLNAIYFTEN